MGHADDRRDVIADGLPLAAEHLADVHDHVQLGRAIVHGARASHVFDERRVPAVGEADGRADGHARAGEELRRQRDGVGLDADARHAVFGGQPAAGLEVGLREGRTEQGVVDPLGD